MEYWSYFAYYDCTQTKKGYRASKTSFYPEPTGYENHVKPRVRRSCGRAISIFKRLSAYTFKNEHYARFSIFQDIFITLSTQNM